MGKGGFEPDRIRVKCGVEPGCVRNRKGNEGSFSDRWKPRKEEEEA